MNLIAVLCLQTSRRKFLLTKKFIEICFTSGFFFAIKLKILFIVQHLKIMIFFFLHWKKKIKIESIGRPKLKLLILNVTKCVYKQTFKLETFENLTACGMLVTVLLLFLFIILEQ